MQQLGVIEAKRSRLLHGGHVPSLREALTQAIGEEYTALLEELITVDQLDREAATVRLGLIGGRDHRVAAVFDASRHLGPDGFDQLAPGDRALVRELWAITVEPMAEANRQLERARDDLAAEQPEVVHDDRFEQVFVALGTKAALTTAPRPVQRAAATAFVVADLVRDTPRALLRIVTPKPLRHVLTAVRVAAHLLGDKPPRQLVPPSAPIQLPPRRKWRPFSVAGLYDPKVVGDPKIFVLDEGKKARVSGVKEARDFGGRPRFWDHSSLKYSE